MRCKIIVKINSSKVDCMARLKNRLEWISKQCKDKKVLDIGTRARSYSKIEESAKSVQGLDIDSKNIRLMRRQGYNVVLDNAESFSLKENFDVIIAGELIEHLSNPGFFLDRASNHLKDEGCLVITTPNARCLNYVFDYGHDPKHIQLYTPRILEKLLRKHRFDVISLQYFNWSSNVGKLISKIYNSLVAFLFPELAVQFGVIAKKVQE